MNDIVDTIPRLSAEDAIELREKGVAGDPESVRLYVLSAVWRSIKKQKKLSEKRRIKTFRNLANSVSIGVSYG